MKNKKDLFALVGLLILATIFSFSYLNFKPKPALSQTSNSSNWTVFKTDNYGFLFWRNTITGAYYEGENSGRYYGKAPIFDVGKRFYLYRFTGRSEKGTPYPRLSCDKLDNVTDYDCNNLVVDGAWASLEPKYLGQKAGDMYYPGGYVSGAYEQVFDFKESVIVKATYGSVYAPLFAATPDNRSDSHQVITKEYVPSILNSSESDWQVDAMIVDHYLDIEITGSSPSAVWLTGYNDDYSIAEGNCVNSVTTGGTKYTISDWPCMSHINLLNISPYTEKGFETGVEMIIKGRGSLFRVDAGEFVEQGKAKAGYICIDPHYISTGSFGPYGYTWKEVGPTDIRLGLAVDLAWGADWIYIQKYRYINWPYSLNELKNKIDTWNNKGVFDCKLINY